jgi:PIN domain nuclease of toxin-antitoxin system
MSRVVLDASAVLAYAMGERGCEAVRERLSGAAMSAVNYSEVLKKTIERGGDAQLIGLLVERTNIAIVPFDERQAAGAAELVRITKDKGLSFADRACMALAIASKAVLYTADSRIGEINAPVRVMLIRQPAARKAT